ncbi:MAG: LysM domain-containing protein [Solirubrobacteraceae bacterium]
MVAKSARFLAPIALVAVAVGVYLIVHDTMTKHHVATTQSSTTVLTTHRGSHHHPSLPKYYVVKSGDTLSAISSKTGVSQSRLQALNPAVSTPPFSLQTGQRLRLRR